MSYSYYYINIPQQLIYNGLECPVEYYLKKYGFDNAVPKPLKLPNNNYVICVPSSISHEFTEQLTNEGCTTMFKNTVTYENLDVTNTYIGESSEWRGCLMNVEYFLSKKVET